MLLQSNCLDGQKGWILKKLYDVRRDQTASFLLDEIYSSNITDSPPEAFLSIARFAILLKPKTVNPCYLRAYILYFWEREKESELLDEKRAGEVHWAAVHLIDLLMPIQLALRLCICVWTFACRSILVVRCSQATTGIITYRGPSPTSCLLLQLTQLQSSFYYLLPTSATNILVVILLRCLLESSSLFFQPYPY